MLTRNCCCTGDSCCETWLKDQFVFIFGELMNSAVPVSHEDLISLKINRPQSRMKSRERAFSTQASTCACCCTQGSIDACDCCPKTRDCVDCVNNTGSNFCGSGNVFAGVNRLERLGAPLTSCCDICSNDCN